jgi:hypothetical protein
MTLEIAGAYIARVLSQPQRRLYDRSVYVRSSSMLEMMSRGSGSEIHGQDTLAILLTTFAKRG